MPQTNFTPIQLYRTATSGTAPSVGLLTNGELALNYHSNDGLLYYKDTANAVRIITAGGLRSATTSVTTTAATAPTSGQFLRATGSTTATWQGQDAILASLVALGTNGHVVRTSASTVVARTQTGTAAEITVTNGDGVSGNPTYSLPASMTFTGKTVTGGTFTGLDADLGISDGGTAASTASAARTNLGTVSDPGSNGITARTSANVLTARTLTGTANEITVTNGDGVSGNPTFSIPSSVTFTGKTFTGGTFQTTTLTAPLLMGSTRVGDGTGSPEIVFRRLAGSSSSLVFATGASGGFRWQWFIAGAESGSDVGSNYELYSYTDAGGFQLVHSIVRATNGLSTWDRPTTFGTNQLSGSNVNFTGGNITNITNFRAAGNGSAAAPLYSFEGDTDTGLYKITTDVPAISAGGVESMRFNGLDPSIGFGVSTSQVSLALANGRTGNGFSTLRLIGDATYTAGGLVVERGNGGANSSSVISHRGTGNFDLFAGEGGQIRFANASAQLTFTSDGRLFGSALHNNAGAVTGATNQYIASGTHTPTGTLGTNAAAITTNPAKWLRVGNNVTVSGSVDISATSANVFTNVELTLPIASNFGLTDDANGVGCGAATAAQDVWRVNGNTGTDRAVLSSSAIAGTATRTVRYHYTYEIK